MILPRRLWQLVHSRTFWTIFICTPLVGLPLYYGIVNLWGDQKLAEARKELADRGYALTWAEWQRSRPAREDDLLEHEVILRKRHDFENELLSKGYTPDNLALWIPSPSNGKRFSAAAVCGKPESEEKAALQQLGEDLATMEPIASEIKTAVRTSKGIGCAISSTPPISTDPSAHTMSSMGHFVLRRAVLRAADGDHAGAMDDLRLIHEYLNLLHSEPRSILSAVIGQGLEVLFARAAWQIAQNPSQPREHLEEIQKCLESLENEKSTIDCFRHQIVFVNEVIPTLFGEFTAMDPESMEIGFDEVDPKQWWPDMKSLWRQVRPVGFFKAELADGLSRIDRKILHLPDGSPRRYWTAGDADQISAIENGPPSLPNAPYVLDSISHVGPAVIRNNLKVISSLRLCRAGIAAESYRREKGRLPASMNDLIPNYLAATPREAQLNAPLVANESPDGGIEFTVQGAEPSSDLRLRISAK